MKTTVTPRSIIRRKGAKENISPLISSKVKKLKHDESFMQSPVIRRRPLSRRNVNSPANASFASYASSISSVASSPVRKKPLLRSTKNFNISDISYKSSTGDETVQSSTFTSPHKFPPLRAKRRERVSVNVSFEDSINQSVSESFPFKKILRRKIALEETMDISYKSDSSKCNNTTLSEPMDILTPVQKKPPLRTSRKNKTLQEITFAASPEPSLESPVREKPLGKKSSPSDEAFSDLTANVSITEQLRNISLRRSNRLSETLNLSRENSATESARKSLENPRRLASLHLPMPESLENSFEQLILSEETPTSTDCRKSEGLAGTQDSSLTTSKKKKRPLSMAPRNRSMLDVTYVASQDPDDSLEGVRRGLPLLKKTNPFELSSSMLEKTTDEGDSLPTQLILSEVTPTSTDCRRSKRLTGTPSQDSSLTIKSSPKKKRPLSVAPRNCSMPDVTYVASQDPDDSLEGVRRGLPLLKKSNPFDLSLSSSRLEEITDEGDSLPRSTRSSTRSLNFSQTKQRPLKKSTVNKTLKEISYLASPDCEQSFKQSCRLMGKHGRKMDISFSGLSYQESLTQSSHCQSSREEESPDNQDTDEKSEDESESQEELDSVPVDISQRLSTQILTPLQEGNLTQRTSSEKSLSGKISSSDKENSYMVSQDSVRTNRRLLGKDGRELEISFSGFSYQESVVDSTTRSEALISDKESESEEEESQEIEENSDKEETSQESEEKSDEEEESQESAEKSDEEEDEMRSADNEDRFSLRLSTEPAIPSKFDQTECVQTDITFQSQPLEITVIRAGDKPVVDSLTTRIQAIMKTAEEKVSKKFIAYCSSPEPVQKPRKRPINSRTKILRPKLYKPAQWANKRLYDYLSQKLQPNFGMRRMLKAEELVKIIYETVQIVEKNKSFQKNAVNRMKLQLAASHVIDTTDDFYRFIRSFLPKTCEDRMIPTMQPFTNIVWPPKDDLKREWEKILD